MGLASPVLSIFPMIIPFEMYKDVASSVSRHFALIKDLQSSFQCQLSLAISLAAVRCVNLLLGHLS